MVSGLSGLWQGGNRPAVLQTGLQEKRPIFSAIRLSEYSNNPVLACVIFTPFACSSRIHGPVRLQNLSKPAQDRRGTIYAYNPLIVQPNTSIAKTLFPLLLSCRMVGYAAAHYADVNGLAPLPPYDSWATAATNIQDAIDAAVAGDEIVVTNGTYNTGGRAVVGTMTNRVVVDKALSVHSVNGPQFTSIQGYQLPFGTNGNGAVRCVYLSAGANLSGFTIAFGATGNGGDPTLEQSGGGVWSESNAVVSNCVLAGNSAYSYGGGAYRGALNNCALVSNGAGAGGGAYQATLMNCNVASNRAAWGGGSYQTTLNNCTLIGNRAGTGVAAAYGGGAYQGTLNDCTLIGNVAYIADGGGAAGATLNHCLLAGNICYGYIGAGAYGGTLSNCSLVGNWTFGTGGKGGGAGGAVLKQCQLSGNWSYRGGGAYESTLINCALSANFATNSGGGAYGGSLTNCTLAGNWAGTNGGGVYIESNGTLNNCILYFNTAADGSNYYVGPWSYSMNSCCTSPAPEGVANLTLDPLFLDLAGGNLRLQSNSPCINAGSNSSVIGAADLDGRPRILGSSVDIGAYEFQPDVSGLFIGWLQQYGLPTDGSADYADSDNDGMNNWQEWRCQTIPTNSISVLRLLSAMPGPRAVHVNWQSVPGVNYFIERCTNLAGLPQFQLVATNITGQAETTTYRDVGAAGTTEIFYRVGVGN
jgi:hypothetical protein